MSTFFATVGGFSPCFVLAFSTFYAPKSKIIVPVPAVPALPEFLPFSHFFASKQYIYRQTRWSTLKRGNFKNSLYQLWKIQRHFQSHYGAIATTTKPSSQLWLEIFNPTMVRLRPIFSNNEVVVAKAKFQSHYGAIATPPDTSIELSIELFQSHYGAIATHRVR